MSLRSARTSVRVQHRLTRPGRQARLRPALAFTLVFLLSGCQPVMTTSAAHSATAPERPYTGTVADWPMFFKRHVFGAFCFDTTACSVVYAGRDHGNPAPTPAKASLGADRYDEIMRGSFGDLANFPPPAELRWTAKDGTELTASVDFDPLFPERLILHNVPRGEIPEDVSMGFTHVLLEIDDRTVTVYTRTMIPTRTEQVPGNRFSTSRDDLIQVWTHTY